MMATRPAGEKWRTRASAESDSERVTALSGRPPGPSRAGTAKMRPSSDIYPSGRPEKISRASAQGAPTRRAWKKAHRAAGKGRAGEGQGRRSGSNGRVVTGAARHEEGATTSERLACRS